MDIYSVVQLDLKMNHDHLTLTIALGFIRIFFCYWDFGKYIMIWKSILEDHDLRTSYTEQTTSSQDIPFLGYPLSYIFGPGYIFFGLS